MRPSIGARLVCTSKIERKIPIRRDLFFRISFSSTSTISVTVPSAAATTRFGSAGVARSGSRKKASVEKTNLQSQEEEEPQKSSVLPGRFGRAYATAFSDSKMAGSSKGEDSESADSGGSPSTTRSWALAERLTLQIA